MDDFEGMTFAALAARAKELGLFWCLRTGEPYEAGAVFCHVYRLRDGGTLMGDETDFSLTIRTYADTPEWAFRNALRQVPGRSN